jgi:ribonuclease BN (tRNA processing enzyme)
MTAENGRSDLPGLDGTRLILLGTKGGPRPSRTRANSANLVVAGGAVILVDCGYGVTRRLLEAGFHPHEVRTILITHHHSDHTLELGPLLYNAWIGGLDEPVDVWGPPPLHGLIGGFLQSMSFDIGIRIADEGRVDPRHLVRVHEFREGGVLFEDGNLRVSAARVHHPPLADAYAFRIDASDRAIVLSGDTTPCPELISLARDADVLVHEVLHPDGIDRLASGLRQARLLREHLSASHTLTEAVGKIAASARVGKLVLTHLVPGDDAAITEDMWLDQPTRDFGKAVFVGDDLQPF